MGKGSVYTPERAVLRDARSGLKIFRLTHSPCVSTNLYFEMCSFTEDDSHVVFISQRYAGRDAPFDLFRVQTDGMDLVQLTECDDLGGIVFSPATGHVFYQSGGEVRKTDVLSMQEETLAEAPGDRPVNPHSLGSIDLRGTTYFGNCYNREGVASLFKVDGATGKLEIIYESEQQNHIHVDPTGKTVNFGDFKDGVWTSCLIDSDGSNLREYDFTQFAHRTWFGDTGSMQGTLLPPGHALVTHKEGEADATVLTEGRYYWHSSSSRDAQWIVSDTNWPQEGIYLLHVPSRTVTYVCDPGASCSHPQWAHPHPSLSPGLGYVLFNSDMTGVGQVYLAELTPEFLEQAAHGYCCRPDPAISG